MRLFGVLSVCRHRGFFVEIRYSGQLRVENLIFGVVLN